MDSNLSTRPPSETKCRIIFKELIGRGSYGEVWLAEWNGSNVAAKRIHKEFFQRANDQEIIDNRILEFNREWELLKTLDHKNIVKMLDVMMSPKNKSPAIIMELMKCDLQQYIKNSSKLSLTEVVSIGLGVAEGLEYLHGQSPPVVHRDLATKNILMTVEGQPKIADLGVARAFATAKDASATPQPGTPVYAAPETHKGIKNYQAKYGVKADMFSFGVVLLEMSVGHEPRVLSCSDGSKISELKRRKKDLDEMEDSRLKKLVIDCLQEKSTSRPNASEVVKELQIIKEEMEVEKRQMQKAVTFEKLCGNPKPQHDHCFKVLLLGNHDVGKSSLFQVLKNPAFNIDTVRMKTTLKIEPMVHYFQYGTQIVKMDLVDTSGEERFFCLTSSYYRDVDGVFLTYDVSDKVSLQSLKFWRSSLKKYNHKDNLQMLLVGNKVDLWQTIDSKEMVPRQEALDMAKRFQCPYVETSVRDFESVMAMYKKMVEMLIAIVKIQDVDIQIEEPNRRTKIVRLPSSRKKDEANKKKCSACTKR